MEMLQDFVSSVNKLVWGVPMLCLLVGTHIFFTFRLRFIQRHLFKAIKISVTKDSHSEGDISQFGALATALAATIGTGNIVGVATAVALGGPGAVLWCWLTGLLGIATKYSEGLLAVKYRVKTADGTMLGGPMSALERGAKMKWLGILFSIFTAIACIGTGNLTQGNSITSMLKTSFNINPYISGAVITVAASVVLLGGVKSIAKVCGSLVPFMAVFYIIGCAVVLVVNAPYLPETVVTIFSRAFTPQAAAGGFAGSTIIAAMRFGISRGLFSNEAGMGSAPIAAAAATTSNPVRQALVSMSGVFWDTIIVCAMTGLVLVSSIIRYPALGSLSGGDLTAMAFEKIHIWGRYILAVGLVTFAFSTILGWAYYGERAVEYLLGKKFLFPYRIIYSIAIYVGCVSANQLVWDIADTFNALMAIPNLLCLLILNGVIVSETKKYLWSNNIDGVDDTPIPQLDK